MKKFGAVLRLYEKAVLRLSEALQREPDEFMRDSAIKRFEIAFDLSWKAAKACLEKSRGVTCASPKGCFREAYRQGIIEYDEFWLELTDLRNEAAHTYDEDLAKRIYRMLPHALARLQELATRLRQEVEGL
jgi:nucleotidyltransferase substrate binding protein (TIGR01987 family)